LKVCLKLEDTLISAHFFCCEVCNTIIISSDENDWATLVALHIDSCYGFEEFDDEELKPMPVNDLLH